MTNVALEGRQVYLRPIVEDDAAALAGSTLIETETGFSSTGRVPTSGIAFRHWIGSIGSREGSPEITFAICRAGDDTCIGTTTLRHIDWINGSAETGSGLFAPEDRGRGLGTEVKALLLAYAFDTLGLHVVTAEVFSGNTRSAAALRKQGYRLAGRLAAQEHRAGEYQDRLIFDLLRDDWLAARAAEHDSSDVQVG